MTVADPREAMGSVEAATLRGSRLFEGIRDQVLDELWKRVQVESGTPGQVLIKEGNIATHMFLVVNGEVEVVKANDEGGSVRVALLGPGDWVGEMSLLDVKPRSATVRVVAPTTLVRMAADDLQRFLRDRDVEQYATLIRNIGRELSRRLRVADGLIARYARDVASRYVEETRSDANES
jgi:CRP-like cAMP-binding protein